MKKISVSLFVLAFALPLVASDWGFRFDLNSKSCKSPEGKIGFNPGFIGECGNLKKADMRYLVVFFPSPVKLIGAVADDADIMSGDLRESDLRYASFIGANLTKTMLNSADLRDSKLDGVKWDGTYLDKAEMSFVDLRKADLRTATMRGTILMGANLQEADLSGNRNIIGINLEGASLEKATLSKAYFYGANLKDAFLDEADLSYSILFDADLTDAQVNGTIFTGAKYSEGTLLPFDEAEAKNRGMVFISDLNASGIPVNIEGKADETCAPTEIHLTVGKKVTFILKATNKMFLFKVPDFKVELMTIPGQSAKSNYTPSKKGEYEFTCGVHNGTKVTKGKIMVM